MSAVLVLHGPNLNLLGTREPELYGHTTLDTINQRLEKIAQTARHKLLTFQSNAEHELVERVHAAQSQSAQSQSVVFIIINPAAFTHTSIALRDALAASEIPFIEVHLSNIYSRESFRRRSYFSDLAVGVISGFGAHGYELALSAALQHLTNSTHKNMAN